MAALLWLAPAAAQAQASKKVEEVDDVDDVEEVEEVEAVASQESAGKPDGTKMIGRLHPLLVHVPIAWLLLLLIVDGASFLLGRPWHRAGRLLLVGAAASTIPAVVTGLLLAGSSAPPGDPAEAARLVLHRNLALAVASVSLLALALRITRPEPMTGVARVLYLVLLLAAAALVGAVGHLGGEMVFGPDYLPF